MYTYSIPSSGYVRYRGYNTSATTSPSSSPSPEHSHAWYHYYPRASNMQSKSRRPDKGHAKQERYSSPRIPSGWDYTSGYTSSNYYTDSSDYYSSPRWKEAPYMSNTSNAYGRPGTSGEGNGPRRHASKASQPVFVDTSDEADDSPNYVYIKPRASHHKSRSDQYSSYYQAYTSSDSYDSSPPRSRARRSSQSTKSRPTATKSKSVKPELPKRVATAADAAKAKIPAGYSLKNWDPTETPILLLGSVFDANSLGKWIFDWTVLRYKAGTFEADRAGKLWILLINLAGKMKRADECFPRIHSQENQELVDDFLISGNRLLGRLKALLKKCEQFMWKAAQQSSNGSIKMGEDSGKAFVLSMFGDKSLVMESNSTEELMESMRLWNKRFDANCEEILRRPRAR